MKIFWSYWWSGLVAGWLAGQFVRGAGFGLIGESRNWHCRRVHRRLAAAEIGIHLGTGIVSAIVNATIGAVLLLLVVRLLQGGGRFGGGWADAVGGSA